MIKFVILNLIQYHIRLIKVKLNKKQDEIPDQVWNDAIQKGNKVSHT